MAVSRVYNLIIHTRRHLLALALRSAEFQENWSSSYEVAYTSVHERAPTDIVSSCNLVQNFKKPEEVLHG